MKGKINEYGFLEIERAGEMKRQECRKWGMALVENDPVSCACGDECPHFREPSKENGVTAVALCEGVIWFFDDFEDER